LEKPKEKGRILDNMRYFFTQQGIFDKRLGLCPSLEFEKLKDLAKNTGRYTWIFFLKLSNPFD
jgi:hypothetical protein